MSPLMARIGPSSLHEQAAENLSFIRATMARAGRFAAVPGWGGACMGVTALVTAALAGRPGGFSWLAWWIADAVVAAGIGLVTMARKGRRLESPLAGAAGRQFVMALVPGLLAGAVLTGVFVDEGLTARL